MPKRSLGPRLPGATSKVVAAASRGPIARAAAKVLVAGDSRDDATRVTRELTGADAAVRVAWRPLLEPASSPDDLITVQAETVSALSALSAAGLEAPDLTIDVATFGVFADDVSGGVLINALREVGQAARNAGVTLTLTVDDPLYLQAALVLGDELRQDFPETGVVLPTRLRGAQDDLDALATSGRRVRLSTERLDAALGLTSARESGNAFVDITKALLDAGAVTAFDTDDALLLDIAASLVRRHETPGCEVVAPLGVTLPAGHDDVLARRVVVPYGTTWSPYVARMLAARPSLALSLPNPARRRR